MSAWPDPERPGVPLNPEREGWHWVAWAGNPPDPTWWTPHGPERRGKCWHWDDEWMGPGWVCANATYHGPCLTPSEVAAQVAAAAEAMREAAALVAKQKRVPFMHIDDGKYLIGIDIGAAIRGLPLPHGDALAAAVTRAAEEE